MVEKSEFSNFAHIGMIVRDLDKAKEYYESLGIGPFEPLTLPTFKERMLMGKLVYPGDIELNVRVAKIGPVVMELLQPIKGSIWKNFLDTKGEGVHHLGFYVDDIDKATANMEKKGFKVIYSSRFIKGGGAGYFDTDKVGGVLTELIQMAPDDIRRLKL